MFRHAPPDSVATALARIASEPGVALDALAPPAFWTMIQRLAGLLRRALPALPERVLLLRARFLFQQTFVVVTELQRMAPRAGAPIPSRDVETIGTDLVDFLIGGLTAPSRSAGEERAVAAEPRPPARAAINKKPR